MHATRWFAGAGLAAGLILAGCGGGQSSEPQAARQQVDCSKPEHQMNQKEWVECFGGDLTPESATPKQVQRLTVRETATITSLGQTMKVTVESVDESDTATSEYAGGDTYQVESANGKFVTAEVEVENTGKGVLDAVPQFAYTIGDERYLGDQGNEWDVVVDDQYTYNPLNPGESGDGLLHFDVPDEDGRMALVDAGRVVVTWSE